jgi:hypothetical protein
MTGDVLRWDSKCTLGKYGIIATLLVKREFAFGMRVKVGPVAVESEHQKRFGIQTRRGNAIRTETSDGRGQGLL